MTIGISRIGTDQNDFKEFKCQALCHRHDSSWEIWAGTTVFALLEGPFRRTKTVAEIAAAVRKQSSTSYCSYARPAQSGRMW